MKIEFTKQSGTMLLQISNYKKEMFQIFENSFFFNNNGIQKKSFPINHPELQYIIKNYAQYGQLMLEQMAYKRPVPWGKGLKVFCRLMRKHMIK